MEKHASTERLILITVRTLISTIFLIVSFPLFFGIFQITHLIELTGSLVGSILFLAFYLYILFFVFSRMASWYLEKSGIEDEVHKTGYSGVVSNGNIHISETYTTKSGRLGFKMFLISYLICAVLPVWNVQKLPLNGVDIPITLTIAGVEVHFLWLLESVTILNYFSMGTIFVFG